MDPQAALARARALFTNHKPAVLLSGAGVAAVLGYRHYQLAGPAGSSDPAAADAADGATIAGYNPAGSTGAAGYDSSATDIYNALQPQIEQTQTMLEKLLGLPPGKTTTITKIIRVPAKKKPPKKKKKPKNRHPKHRPGKPREKHPGRPRPAPRPRKKAPAPKHHHPPKTPHKTGHRAPKKGTIATRRGATLSTAHKAGGAPAPVRRA